MIFAGYDNLTHNTNTEYNALAGGYNWTATEALRSQVVSTNGLIKNLRVRLNGSPGAGKSYDFTLMLNGAPTALTVEIADAATSGNDATEIAVVAGDSVSLRCVPTGTPSARFARWTSVFQGDTARESLILGVADIPLDTGATEYSQVMAAFSGLSNVEDNFRQVVPTSGTIKNFYVKLTVDPGTAPDAYRFTIRLNGATVAQSLIVTITANDTTGNDLAHNLAVVAGDVLTMMIEPLNTPSATPKMSWGMTFLADIDGESIILGGSENSPSDAAARYYYLTSTEDAFWFASEAQSNQLGQLCTLKKLYILLSGSPGAGNKYTFTVRIAGASSNVLAEVADAATTGNSGALVDIVADDAFVDLQAIPTSTPTVRDAYWGLVSAERALVNFDRSATVIVGVTVTASRVNGIIRTALVIIGQVVKGRIHAFQPRFKQVPRRPV